MKCSTIISKVDYIVSLKTMIVVWELLDPTPVKSMKQLNLLTVFSSVDHKFHSTVNLKENSIVNF